MQDDSGTTVQIDNARDRSILIRTRLILVLHLLLLLAAALITLSVGRYPEAGFLSPARIAEDPFARTLILQLRLPRLLLALVLGASLGGAGSVFQMLFANPLVEPGFLGVSQGAAFGASLGIVVLGGSALAVQGSAVLWAGLGLLLSYGVARRLRYGGRLLRLLLSGIAVSAFFSAALGAMKLLADPMSQLPEITFWLMGGLWNAGWDQLISVTPLAGSGLILLLALRWRLNVLSLPELSAHSLGARPGRERALLLGGAVAAVAAVISASGLVGWTGLIVPHLARRVFGSDARYSLPGSMIIGATFTVLCDALARSLLPGEIPLGIVTSMLGAVLFLLLLSSGPRRARR